MQLTFRNHRRVQLPVFTNSQVFFCVCFFFFLFFQGNATAEQVNVIQHGANHFPSLMKRSDGWRRGDSFSCRTAWLCEMSCPDRTASAQYLNPAFEKLPEEMTRSCWVPGFLTWSQLERLTEPINAPASADGRSQGQEMSSVGASLTPGD